MNSIFRFIVFSESEPVVRIQFIQFNNSHSVLRVVFEHSAKLETLTPNARYLRIVIDGVR